MAAAEVAEELDAEARLFARYLVGRIPPDAFIARYRDANAAILAAPTAESERALLAFVRRHPWSVGPLDGACGLLAPGGLLRNKILLMAAVLEASTEFADDFLPRSSGRARLVLELVAAGCLGAAQALVGALLLPDRPPLVSPVDVLIVGSGPGGVNAAAPLVAAGHRVVLLDYGNVDSTYARLIPKRPFSELRRSDAEQHRYLLGERYEGVPLGDVRVGAQLTPPRKHLFADAADEMAIETDGFQANPSLARGGLGAGWSAGVFPFSDDELQSMGLGLDDFQPHYDSVTERIGVCGERDDLESFFAPSPAMMPALEPDSNAAAILARYEARRAALHRDGFFLARTRLAVCTEAHRGRGPESYLDLGYWADMDRSIYRPQWTLEELLREDNFRYLDRQFVERFDEAEGRVRVTSRHADSGEIEIHEAGALVLAAGAIGSARIALRSLGRYDTPVPMLCNPYAYVPMLNLGTFGTPIRDQRHSMAQLTAMVRRPGPVPHVVQSQVFSYRSLLTFKLMKESPLAYGATLRIMRSLIPYFAILGVHHEDRPTAAKTCRLLPGESGGPDRIRIDYQPDAAEERVQRDDERAMLRVFRRLGCLPIRTIRPGHGANIHYAGTLPIQPDGGDLTCDRDGRLRGTQAVYVADGSAFPWLPAKGLTFTIMANADRVGTGLAKRLR